MKTVGVICAFLLTALCGALSFAAEPDARPNVILISLDTLRADHLGCYGYPRKTSPNLNKFANEGILFEEMTAASAWTVESHMSIFTALYPSVHGIKRFDAKLGDAVPTIAEILSKHGYTTAGFVSGPSLNHAMGFDRGFQLYDDSTVSLMNETIGHDQDVDKNDVAGLTHVSTNATITNLVTTWLRKHLDEKFFLFVHYWDCHSDYIPPAPWDKKFDPECKCNEDGRNITKRHAYLEKNATPEAKRHLIALYDGEVAQTDQEVGNLLKILDELKLKENTLVIILSDHGEGFWDHGLIEHGNSMYEELIHVPAIIRWPQLSRAGQRIKGNVSHVDILPTLLGLLDIPKPEIVNGVDLSEVCRGRAEVPDRPVFSDVDMMVQMRAVRWGEYKVMQEGGKRPGPLWVVQEGKEILASDLGLKAKVEQEAQLRLAVALSTGAANPTTPLTKAKPAKVDEKTLRLLRSLGYMQ